MKTLITYTFIICILLTSFLSCNNHNNTTERSGCIDPKPISDRCSEMVPLSSYRIDNDSALAYISNYQNYAEEVKDSLSIHEDGTDHAEKLIYGVHVHANELRDIIGQSHGEDSLWVMMAIKPNGKTAMIFTLRSRNTTSGEECWSFFDFTQPCPTSCPNLILRE